jgi:hypothetical protein
MIIDFEKAVDKALDLARIVARHQPAPKRRRNRLTA